MTKKMKTEHIFRCILCSLILMLLTLAAEGTEVSAKSNIRLSVTEKKVVEGDRFTITLKGISSKVKDRKLKWKIAEPDVLKITKRTGNKITLKALEDGRSTVSIKYKGKTYKCKVYVRSRDSGEWNWDSESPSIGGVSDDTDTAEPADKYLLNASAVEIHYIDDYAVPYIGKNPAFHYSFDFDVVGSKDTDVKWSIEGDSKVIGRYRITDDGEISMFRGNAFGEDFSECTVVAALSNGNTLRAKVRGYDDCGSYIRKVMDDFKETYISTDMSDYEKMDRVAWYLSSEYDYELYQDSWYRYIITGSGDCMASRWAVMYFCRDLGLKAAACPNLDSHGMTVVRADGKVYLVTTGFTGRKPRYYEIREITRETFDKINEGNHIDPDYIWIE